MSRKKSEALTIAAELMADMGCCIHDAAILTLCLLACMAAECIPLLLPLVATAGVLARAKEKPLRVRPHPERQGGTEKRSTKLFRP